MILGTTQGLAYVDPFPVDYGASAPPTASIVGDFMTRAGLVDSSISTALTTFVDAIKTAGLWGKFIAIYPVVGGTATAHAQNLVSGTFPITWNGTVTHDGLGSRSDGTTGYGDTGIVLNSLTLDDLALSAYATYATATTGTLIGASNGSTISYQVAISNGVFYADMNSHSSGRLQTSLATPPGGLFVANRQSTTLAQAVRDAAVHASIASAVTTGAVSGNLCVLAQGGTMTNTGHHPYPVRFIAVSKGIPTGSLAAYNTAVINLLTSLNRVKDVDADDYLLRAALTDGKHVGAIYNLVRDLRLAALWPKMLGLYPFVGGTATAHAQNLFANLWNITWVNAPTHSADGVKGNGTSSYGNAAITPSTVGNNGGISVWIKTAPVGNGRTSVGANNGTLLYDITHDVTSGYGYGRWGGTAAVYYNAAAAINTLYSMSRRSTTDLRMFKNGAQDWSEVAVTAGGSLGINLFNLANNGNGTPAFHSDETQAFLCYHQGMTPAESLDFYNTVLAYQTRLGR